MRGWRGSGAGFEHGSGEQENDRSFCLPLPNMHTVRCCSSAPVTKSFPRKVINYGLLYSTGPCASLINRANKSHDGLI